MSFISYKDFLLVKYQDLLSQGIVNSQIDFARYIGVSKATLSELLAGKHAPSWKTIEKISHKLNFTLREKEFLVNLVRKDQKKNTNLKTYAEKKVNKQNFENNTNPLTEEEFAKINTWQHLALFDQLKLPYGPKTLESLSKLTSIPDDQLLGYLNDLKSLGLVNESKGSYTSSRKPLLVHYEDKKSQLIQDFHRDAAKHAVDRMSVDPVEREYSYTSLYVSADEIGDIKNELIEFRRYLQVKYQLDDEKLKQKLYALNIKLYPVFG